MTRVLATKTLAPLKAAAIRKIDIEAEQVRLRVLTPGAGQALVYEAKRREASEFKHAHDTGQNPNVAQYPLVQAEIGITAPTAIEVAQTILALAQQWSSFAGLIEAARLGAKRAVELATTPAAIETASTVSWPQLP
jgi:hypothetical protein